MWQYNHTISSEEEQYLMHYGVKGMKWCKRKTGQNLANLTPTMRSLPGRVTAHKRATSSNTADANARKRIDRARAIENKYGKGTLKSAKAIRRDQQIQDLKGRVSQAGRTAGYRAKQGVRAGAKAAKSKANQAVNSLKAEIKKRKRVSTAKKTAKTRLKKYKNSTVGYQRRIK